MTDARTGRVYKVLAAEAWRRAGESYPGGDDDRRDGFVHFSTAQQLAETLRRHFAGAGPLVLLEVDVAALGEALRWEPARGGALFPHLYGPLRRAAVRREWPLRAGEDGAYALPGDLG